mmetsp:Transcript_77307/g.121741  ORF Transcript_77307/g.121741 Transcript_77307/m.121741 type:complete len:221 (-) Transcript_77307:97-759(-)
MLTLARSLIPCPCSDCCGSTKGTPLKTTRYADLLSPMASSNCSRSCSTVASCGTSSLISRSSQCRTEMRKVVRCGTGTVAGTPGRLLQGRGGASGVAAGGPNGCAPFLPGPTRKRTQTMMSFPPLLSASKILALSVCWFTIQIQSPGDNESAAFRSLLAMRLFFSAQRPPSWTSSTSSASTSSAWCSRRPKRGLPEGCGGGSEIRNSKTSVASGSTTFAS